ncbi:adapter SH3BGRL-like isoform X4 [Narcine bancroftii]|uniref:adapter SH3BGRL-like isoform X4 n=1 Tax=Narcine bancroftii TaxID=1343680 RepID=UPI003831571B
MEFNLGKCEDKTTRHGELSFHFIKVARLTINEIKKQQQEVLDYLQANKIEFERCDIAVNDESKMFMRENVPENYRPVSGIPLPPQIFNNDHYCGNFEAFFDARENNAVYAFLGLTAPPGSKEAEALTKQEA